MALLLLLPLCVGRTSAAAEPPPPELFTGATAATDSAPVAAASLINAAQQESLRRYRERPTSVAVTPVRLHRDALAAGAAVVLNLPGRRAAVLDRVEADWGAASGGLTWSGSEGPAAAGPVPPAEATLVVDAAGNATGTLRVDGRLYALRSLGGGLHALIEVDPARFPPDHPPGGSLRVPRAAAPDVAAPAARDSAASYRVLVAYTPAARRAEGGNIGGLIRLAVAETNRGYASSGVRTRAVLAGTFEAAPAEGVTMGVALARFQRRGDGFLDGVHARRDRARADVAILVSAHTDFCGMAYPNASASYAFGVVSYDCATGYYSFAHEIGHIQGAHHNPQAGPLNTPFAYGHGYYDEIGGWRTIMSYDCPSGCRRVNRWSNPYLRFEGRPTGTAARHHNARVLNQTAGKVANFRQGGAP